MATSKKLLRRRRIKNGIRL